MTKQVQAPIKRDDVRKKIFGNTLKGSREIITLFGAEIEIRQPTLGMILEAQQEVDRRKALVRILVNYCFVPGTDDHVFDETDEETILQLPFGPELTKLNEVIARMTAINVASAEKNSGVAQQA